LPEERRNDYQLLAGDLLNNKLYKDLLVEMRRAASLKMFNESQVIDDILFGKAMLYTIQLMDNKLKLIKSGLTNEARQIK
jgi:hypothetical protein